MHSRERVLTALNHEEPDRVPIAELGVDQPVKEAFLGKPVCDVRADVEFWWRAGYDYIYLRPAYEFPHTMPGSMTTGAPSYRAENLAKVRTNLRKVSRIHGLQPANPHLTDILPAFRSPLTRR